MISKLAALIALLALWSSAVWAQATNYCNNQSYNTFEVATSFIGHQPTIAQLNASQHGFNNGTWTQNGGTVMTYSSVDMPALVAPGRLCADSTTYTNVVGSTGIVFTGDGGLDFNEIVYNLGGTVPVDVWATVEYNEDYGDGDPSKIDAFNIHGNNDYVLLNAYGTGNPGGHRFFTMECAGSGCSNLPHFNWEPSTQCPCKIILHYQAASSGGVAGTHSLTVLDKNGLLIGTITHASETPQDLANRVYIGDGQFQTPVTSGKHSWFDNLQISLDNSIPGQFCAGASPTWTASPDNATLQTCIDNISSGDTINLLSGTATWSTAEVTNFNNKVPMNIIGQTVVTGWGTPTPSANDTTPGSSTTIYMNHTAGNGASLGLAVPRSGCPTPTSTIPCLRLSGLSLIIGTVGPNGSIQIFDANNTWPPSAGRFRVDNIHDTVLSGSGTGDIFYTQDVYGLFDRIWSQSHSANTIVHFAHFGDAGNKGFAGWNTPLALGTDQAVYVENYSVFDDFCNTSGAGDGNQGARAVYRHGYELNGHLGFHGTDSGSELSMFSVESYNNSWVNNVCTTTVLTNYTLRGGTLVAYNDIFSGTAAWGAGKLQQLRADPTAALDNDWSTWGYSNGTPWFLNSAILGNLGTQQVTTSGVDWQPSHTYTCSQPSPCVIIPTSNNAGNYNYVSFASCTSSSTRPNPFNQAPGSTTSDGGAPLPVCNWINGWGTTSTGANAQFCALNQDVLVTTLSQCPVGDQTGPLRFFDGPSSAFGYPGRNQVGRSNNGLGTGETLNPVYQWLNTGIPNPGLFVQNDPTGNFIHECRDYYQQQGSPTFTGACSAGNGVGVGTLAARPSTCTAGLGGNTPGVGYWATDTNTLYVCNPANTWTAYYTPLVYPHPLAGGGGGGSNPIASLCQSSVSFNFANTGTVNTFHCTITNTGTGTLTWTTLTSSGSPFGVTAGTCPLSGGSLGAGSSCNFTIIFSPTTQSSFVGTVALSDNSPGAPHSIALSGNGASIAPAAQVFANNLAGCKQAEPLMSTWCFTADGKIAYSTCTPVACTPFRSYYLIVQGLAQ